jgi:hypothetical protein
LETSEDYGNPVTAIQEAPVSYSKKTYAPGEVIVLERPVYNGNPGRCAVKYTYDSRQVPESFNMKTHQIENNADVWRGLIESNEISWQVVEPAGVDLEAMKAYQTTIPHAIRGLIIQQWKDELLARFPASTYAAYAWFGQPGSPRVAMSPEEFLANVHKEGFLTGAFKTDKNRNPIPDGKGGYLWRTAEDIQQDIIEQGTLILGQHSDFPYRDELRFRIAQAHIALGQDGQACKLFEVLANEAASERDRAKARRYLELLAAKSAQRTQ